MDPLIVRLLIPLGILSTLFFLADFVVTSRWLARNAGKAEVAEGRKRNRALGIGGLLLVTVLGIVAAVTFAYRREVSLRRVQEQEALTPSDTSAREALQARVRLEYLALIVPVVLGSASGLILRRLDRRWRTMKANLVADTTFLNPRQGA
jgi:hypothetical protein